MSFNFVSNAQLATSFSAEAKEFVPGFMAANEVQHYSSYTSYDNYYNPYMTTVQPTAAPAGMMLLSLDGYSDESSDSDSEKGESPKFTAPWKQTIEKEKDLKGCEAASGIEESPTKVPPWKQASWKQKQDDTPATTAKKASFDGSLSTPTASTSEPESDAMCFDSSDSSDKEQETMQEETLKQGSTGQAVQFLSIATLLRERHAVDPNDGIEDALGAVEVPQHELPKVDDSGSAPTSKPSRKDTSKKAPGGQRSQKPARPQKTKSTRSDSDWRGGSEGELMKSTDSWTAQQTAHRRASQTDAVSTQLSDEDVVRSMKSILNKLTVEKFERLSQQLAHCGVQTTFHLEMLIKEVFEKATTQHHFIDMYADLCVLLNNHFIEHPIGNGLKMTFKKVLLNGCQAFFEKHLKPPTNLQDLDEEERVTLELNYKTQMLGNIKFVGALLVRQMLATKVLFAICEELLNDPTPESLESLAALLTVIGPKLDRPESPAYAVLGHVFQQVKELTRQEKVKQRVKCLLKDVLDLRASSWQDRKPKKIEGPSTLKEVADTQAAEEAASGSSKGSTTPWSPPRRPQGKPSPTHGDTKKRISSLASDLFKSGNTSPQASEGYKRINSLAALMQGKEAGSSEKAKQAPHESLAFDREQCRKEVSGALAELRASHDVQEAIVRIRDIAIPPTNQAEELCHMLGHMVEQGAPAARKVYFEVVAGLFVDGRWESKALDKGLKDFVQDVVPDLACDVPALPNILRDELYPVLTPLVNDGLLQASVHDVLISS